MTKGRPAQKTGAPPAPSGGAAAAAPSTARDLARGVLLRVETGGAFAGRALSAALDRAPSLSPPDRRFATELVYGALRRQSRLDRALRAFADRGVDGLDPAVRIALRVAAYQILFLDRVPAYAAVSDAVEAVKKKGGRGVAGFANAVLRRLADRGEPALPDAADDPVGYAVEACGLPEWVARRLADERGGAETVAFARASSAPAPLALRANTLRVDRDGLRARLLAERPGARLDDSPLVAAALLARDLDAVARTTPFREGHMSILDLGAQVAAELCGAAPGERILDACAGTGGKTAALAALAGNRAVIDAVDIAPAKLREARDALVRLGIQGVTTRAADLLVPGAAGAAGAAGYQRILLDAPCAGLGVLRRHPEAMARRTPGDLPALAERQQRLLQAVAGSLAPGGLLVYAVCTFERQECEDVVDAVLRARPELTVEPPPPGPLWALGDARGFVRTWPQHHDADAFFVARLRRAPG